jgi:uncharacterized protein (DUF1015 family)
MVKVRPFAGYTPPSELAGRLIVPPYDVVNTEEARAAAEGNEVSFFRVDKPEIDLPSGTDPYADLVYETGRRNLWTFVKNGWLVRDEAERFYVYALEATIKGRFRRQVGIYVAASCEDYASGKIKRHELTLEKKEKDRTRLTDTQGANVSPVFLTYPAKPEIDQVVDEIVASPPYFDVVTEDGVRHQIWKGSEALNERIVGLFGEIECSYIADGHHRAASAYNVARARRAKAEASGDSASEMQDFFCALMFPDNQLQVLDYNRLLKDLNGKTAEQVMAELQPNFEVAEVADPNPLMKGHFSLFIEGRWYGLRLKEGVVTSSDPAANLDSQILTDLVLAPIFGVADLRTSSRIDFVGGIRGLEELERRCRGDCKAAIALYPVSIREIFSIANSNSIMPPKSTWFEPKPRSGTVVRVFDAIE